MNLFIYFMCACGLESGAYIGKWKEREREVEGAEGAKVFTFPFCDVRL